MPTGRLRWLDAKKGYGMIMPSDGSNEVFVELDDIRFETCRNDICQDERVMYEVRKTARKKKAKNVRSLESVL